MKKIMLILLALICAAAFAGCVVRVADNAYELSGIDNVPDKLTLPAGSTLVIKLDANATTGYAWLVAIADETVMALVSNEYTASDTGLAGSGGTATITLSAKKAGETDVTLTYKQDWEGGETDTVKTVAVTVQ